MDVPLGLPLFLLILELAVIHDPADGGIGIGRDLDQVQPQLLGVPPGLLEFEDADLLVVRVDYPYLFGLNLVIGPRGRALLPAVTARTSDIDLLLLCLFPPSLARPGEGKW